MSAHVLARRLGRRPGGAAGALTFAAALLVPGVALGTPAVALPTVTPVADCTACPALRRPDPETERQLALLGRELDSAVAEAAQDLGLTLDLSSRPETAPVPMSEDALVQQAASAWVFSPRIGLEGSNVIVRIVA